jgi:signal transduction histidine kinase
VILFQSARELVYNLIKHAQARSGSIGLASDPTGLVLSVEDDGVGFPEPAPGAEGAAGPGQGGRFGLYSVRERIALLGGRLDIAPLTPGSRVSIRLPPASIPG